MHRVFTVIDITDDCVVLEIYPRTMKKHSQEDRKAGAPAFKLDRLTVGYHSIAKIVSTLLPTAKDKMGFKA
jgi:hypothetical protein